MHPATGRMPHNRRTTSTSLTEMPDPKTMYYILAAVLVLVGLAGVVLPALPGLPLVFLGMLLAAWAGDFQQVGGITLVLLAIMTLVSLVVDFWATAVGAKRVGASRLAIIGAMVGTLVGLFAGLVGVFIGPFVGALAGELIHRRGLARDDLGQAARIGLGTWVGIVFGVVLKIGLAFAMLGVFLVAWLIP